MGKGVEVEAGPEHVEKRGCKLGFLPVYIYTGLPKNMAVTTVLDPLEVKFYGWVVGAGKSQQNVTDGMIWLPSE